MITDSGFQVELNFVGEESDSVFSSAVFALKLSHVRLAFQELLFEEADFLLQIPIGLLRFLNAL